MIDDALREELSALLDGALPEARAAELRRRMEGDAALRREYEEIERAARAVRALKRAPAPAALRVRLGASLGAQRAPVRISRFLGLAAAAAALLVATVLLYLRGDAPVRREEAKNEPLPARPADDRQEDLDAGRLSEAKEESAVADRVQERDDAAASKKLGAPPGAPGARAAPAAGKPKEAARAKARLGKDEPDLVAAVAETRVLAPESRKAYLRQVVALGAGKAREHVLAVFGGEADAREARILAKRDGGIATLATILLKDREEATLVTTILGVVPEPPAGAPTAAVMVEQEAKDQVSAEVEGTPEDLERFARWLSLLDLSVKDPRPTVTAFGETKAEEKEPRVRKAVVLLRYGKPPEPEPSEKPREEK